jgi:methyl-accepting chemotaxis protein
MNEISAASEQQNDAIGQVNTAVEQMNSVTQQTAANAEESASAAEELASQAQEMEALISQYKLNALPSAHHKQMQVDFTKPTNSVQKPAVKPKAEKGNLPTKPNGKAHDFTFDGQDAANLIEF